MQKQIEKGYPQPERWSYLWLALGAVLLCLSTGQFRLAFAAWVAPAFLIRFIRSQRAGKGYWLTLLAMYVSLAISWRAILAQFFPSWPVYLIFIVFIAVQNSLPYLADRLLVPRLKGFTATLVFPLAVTALFLLSNLRNPFGSFGTPGYEQYNNLALIQLVSVTGLWGLTFLVSWFGPVANWAWERSFSWPQIRAGLAIFAGVVGVVLLFGGLRLAFPTSQPGTVRVHGFYLESAWDEVPDMNTEMEAYRRFTRERNEQLIQETIRQADLGAQMVLWNEMAAIGVAEDIDQLIARGREVAQQEGIYLAMGLGIHFPGEDRPWEVKLVVIAPSSEIVIDHDKYGATFMYGLMGYGAALQGEYSLQAADTPFGTLSGVVCWDADFPMTVRQAGAQKADLLLVANGDSDRPYAKLHAQQHIFRAIENGLSLVRQDAREFSLAADPYGRVLAMVDLRAVAEPVMSVQVPTQGVFTLYSVIGDLFGWLTVVGFVLIAGWGILSGRRSSLADYAPSGAKGAQSAEG
ncbi:MAG TPA: nitrilase-related carbon-nitrogen hydrolase [Anaerolineales bacterium]|nr:nitrilase-related carbon-nitrogen hydrolase [Anaerolineales bacterium]